MAKEKKTILQHIGNGSFQGGLNLFQTALLAIVIWFMADIKSDIKEVKADLKAKADTSYVNNAARRCNENLINYAGNEQRKKEATWDTLIGTYGKRNPAYKSFVNNYFRSKPEL